MQTQDRAAGLRPPLPGDPPDSYAFLASLTRDGEHGREFRYCSANTDVLGWILERVSGRRYGDLLTERLWAQLGAEHDAYVTVDRAGFPLANGGVCATLRDLARFGVAVLDGGSTTGRALASAQWVAALRRGGDPRAAAAALRQIHPNGSYGTQWWHTHDIDGCFYGTGIFGQYLWIDPTAEVVVAKFSSLPVATSPDYSRDHAAAFRAVVKKVRQEVIAPES